ncbi:hypothetical protein CPB83DRAFT_182809 [Crepidotus variabilis]|uniref:Uncharacterized protein n=1 Tax=Crepidotus variabilis TaxID=179855 RepID=A0A9P6EKD7_9AGAR|nr:hypothetical protein CPB83DRAFT_182809 [Crepidotus variabilis]
MENSTLSSPERGLLVTYLDRRKRRRTVSQVDSDSESNAESKPSLSPSQSPKSPNTSAVKAVASHGPKKVEVSLPGPSPKRVRRDSNEPDKPMSKKAVHVRATSSVTSLKQVIKKVQETPASAKKPDSIVGSTRKPKSKAKSVAEDDDDESASVAESTLSTGRVRRNESERILYFENQPECGKLDPHQVQCLRCNKSISLGRKQTYTVRPWELHRARCDQRPAYAPPATPDINEASTPARVPQSPSIALSVSTKPTPARRPSEQERKEFLESDKQIETVEKHRVLCWKCQSWVDLSQAHGYVTSNWMRHKVRCSDAVPSTRVAAAKRRLNLVNDPQATSIDTHHVVCAYCSATVKLEGDGDFNPTKWEEHKSKCTKSAPNSQNENTSTVLSSSQTTRPPPSSASTEDTVVVDVGTSQSSRPNPSLKRPRDKSEQVPEEDEHKDIRPRTESYIPPKMDPPDSLLGWFMLPFHSFVRGFKESLKDRS